MRRHVPVLALLLTTALGACAGRTAPPDATAHVASDSTAADSARPTRRPRRRSDQITVDEFGGRSWTNLYEVVSTLRSNWLHRRGSDSIYGVDLDVQVVMDGFLIGGADQLRAQSVVGVMYLQHFDPAAASARWGLGFGKGAIYVSTRAESSSRAGMP